MNDEGLAEKSPLTPFVLPAEPRQQLDLDTTKVRIAARQGPVVPSPLAGGLNMANVRDVLAGELSSADDRVHLERIAAPALASCRTAQARGIAAREMAERERMTELRRELTELLASGRLSDAAFEIGCNVTHAPPSSLADQTTVDIQKLFARWQRCQASVKYFPIPHV